MSVYSERYEYDGPPRRYYEEERRDVRYAEPRREDHRDAYYNRPASVARNELVPRARPESELSVEEVRRDFPPPGHARDMRRDDYSHRSHGHHKKAGSVLFEEEERRKRVLGKQEKIIAAVLGGVVAAGAKEVWDRREARQEGLEVDRSVAATAALGAAGAFAGYSGAGLYNKQVGGKTAKKSHYVAHRGRDGQISEYYSDEEDDPRGRKGHKSFLQNALSAAGLGSAIKALTGSSSRSRSRSRSRGGSRGGSRSRSKNRDTPAARLQKAAKASLVAGAAEAFRVSKEPGGWQGEKMKRILTVAAGAGTVNAAHDPRKDKKRHLVESVIGGLVGNRMLNGSRKDIEEDSETGRSRSRSRAGRSSSRGSKPGGRRGSIAALATAGLGALGTKKLLDRSRSRSRRGSVDSYDSRSPSRDRRGGRSRSRSIVDGARRSLAKFGLGSGDRREDEDDYDDRRSRRHYDDDDDYTSRGYMRGGRGDDYYDDNRSVGSRRRDESRSRGGRSHSVSSAGDSDDDRKKTRRMKDERHRRHRHRDDY